MKSILREQQTVRLRGVDLTQKILGGQSQVIAAEFWEAQDATSVSLVGGIASGEAFGSPTIALGAIDINLSAVGAIAGAEAFGSSGVSARASATGIASAAALGALTVKGTASPSGIATAEGLGAPATAATTSTTALAGAEAFGSPELTEGIAAASLEVGGIAADEAFGNLGIALQSEDVVGDEDVFAGEWVDIRDLIRQVPPEELPPPAPAVLQVGSIASAESMGRPTLAVALGARGLLAPVMIGVVRAEPFGPGKEERELLELLLIDAA